MSKGTKVGCHRDGLLQVQECVAELEGRGVAVGGTATFTNALIKRWSAIECRLHLAARTGTKVEIEVVLTQLLQDGTSRVFQCPIDAQELFSAPVDPFADLEPVATKGKGIPDKARLASPAKSSHKASGEEPDLFTP